MKAKLTIRVPKGNEESSEPMIRQRIGIKNAEVYSEPGKVIYKLEGEAKPLNKIRKSAITFGRMNRIMFKINPLVIKAKMELKKQKEKGKEELSGLNQLLKEPIIWEWLD